MSKEWDLALCGCCSIKDCGPTCCINECCCCECMNGSLAQKIATGKVPVKSIAFGLEGDMICYAWTAVFCCAIVPCQQNGATAFLGLEVGKAYGIEESLPMVAFKAICCPCCYLFQIKHEVMLKEHLKYGCMRFEADGEEATMLSKGGAPAPYGTDMQRK